MTGMARPVCSERFSFMTMFMTRFGRILLGFLLCTITSPAWGQVLMPLSGTRGAESINDGVGQYHQRNWDAAVAGFQKALQADPNSAVAHYNMGLTLSQMGQQDKAARHFKLASQFGGSNPFIRNSPDVQHALERQVP